ncbi:DUF2806 domain-containing protein [Bradyrhizobium sp. BRP56]|uniref:DUF2806 domain-containing protein n=1 Tax=Bradyrhizobium sp. BRP56 TaxID=2793819 RepID=UPI001CD1E7B6|nr:DUF2806 domain-containing protein [Bradyrhizobium sp. BRP56]MCA1401936.1 DUF2806 domain-containing protein [Bradyrhizobium sp. BRP56]
MSNDVVPSPSGSFLDEINLPKLVAGPAGEAIARLIGGAVDIPAAWLAQVAQGVKDKTAAKTAVSKAVADAAANLAKNDPEIVQRAAHSLLSKELRHQTNKEAVAKKALEELGDEPLSKTEKPDDDWFNVFERYAEDASSEQFQDIWGRILAGQLRKPKAFSLQTLRFVSELDEHIASLFEKWSARVIDGDYIADPPKQGDEFTELLQLEDFGLVSGASAQLTKTLTIKEDPPSPQLRRLSFEFKDHTLIALMHDPVSITIQNVLLTRVGREIYTITKAKGTLQPIKEFANSLPKHNAESIVCFPKNAIGGGLPSVLWTKPTQDQDGQAGTGN